MEIITQRYRRETGKSAYKHNWFGKRIHNQDYVDWLEKQCVINVVVFNEAITDDNWVLDEPYSLKRKDNIEEKSEVELCGYKTCNEKSFMYGYCKHHLAQQDL